MRRRLLSLVPVILAALVAAACGGGDDERPRATGATGGRTTSTAPPETAAPAPTTTSAPTTTARPGSPSTTARSTRPPTTQAADPTEPAPGSGAVEPTATDDGSGGPPGAFARTMLRPRPATTVVLERLQQPGAEPATSTMAFARETVGRVTAKTVVAPAAVALAGGGDGSWTADELRALADGSGRTPQGGGNAVVRMLFLRGTFEGSSKVLGVAVRGDVLAVFSDSVARASTPVLSGDTIEEAVLVHELGHLLGLVDLARDTRRGDPEHPGHSTNERSVMYWAVESDLIGQLFAGPPPRDFDAADLADLEALRSGE